MKKLLLTVLLISIVASVNAQTTSKIDKIDSLVKAIDDSKEFILKKDSGSYSYPLIQGKSDVKQHYRKEYYFNKNKKLVKSVSYSGMDKISSANWNSKTTCYFKNDKLIKYVDEIKTDHAPQALKVYVENDTYLNSNLSTQLFDFESVIRAGKRSINQSKKFFK